MVSTGGFTTYGLSRLNDSGFFSEDLVSNSVYKLDPNFGG
jgi:hypothetical protein